MLAGGNFLQPSGENIAIAMTMPAAKKYPEAAGYNSLFLPGEFMEGLPL